MVGALVDAGLSELLPSYVDAWGGVRELDPATRRALLAELEQAPAPATQRRLDEKNLRRCHQPEALEHGGRVWGFMVQLYGLRSAGNWGIGDFGDLRRLVEIAAGLGASLVGVNPLHAAHVSPYSPSSRHALNGLYLDVEAIPEYEGRADRARLKELRSAGLVDHGAVAALKRTALEKSFQKFRKQKDRDRLAAFAAFRAAAPKGLRDYVLFEALREAHGGGAWQSWPEEYRSPRSRAVAAFAAEHEDRVAFHAYVQWNARLQLDALQRHAHELGMPIGLYVDLALGADAGGAEVWSDQAAFATGASTGAPPDEFNPRGQDWGLPPYHPRSLAAADYRPFAELLRANMPEGGALRMDHVMALSRLYWIPRGHKPDAGGYVRYPFRELLQVLAGESARRRCLVIGEDLGTVPPELRSALNEAGVLSYRPLLFEKDARGRFRPPEDYPRDALVCVSTHDLPTLRGFFEGTDLVLRERLGLTVDAAKERALRESDRAGLAAALERAGLPASALGAHAFLARTPSKILLVQPEDVLELREQANLPGSVDGHPNWRRRLPLPLEDWLGDERMRATAEAIAAERGAGKRMPGSTYRLQLNADFRFADATALVPYLAALGVTHVYLSPILKARPGSRYGYDVVDHNALNPELGTPQDLDALVEALTRLGMGVVLDIVPNHMGVLQADNAWWRDVLAKGRASPYSSWFDIEWLPAKPELRGKVLLPVLGRHYGEALESGEIRLERSGRGKTSEWLVRYFDHAFPLNAKSARAAERCAKERDTLALHQLLEQQYWRLAFWRVASDEINYRRFFEIAELAALRVEERAVFEATHALIARLCRRRGFDGLRIDHPDGLADPRAYFERLAALCREPWIVIEKIVADHESLPPDWPVHGTTGYRFSNLLTGLFVDGRSEARFDRIWRQFSGEQRAFEEISRESRMLIMNTTLAADLNVCATQLARIAAGNRYTRDYTADGLRRALSEVAAHFPVYRTYVTEQGASETDRRYIDWAVRSAQRASRVADPSVFDFIRGVLTLEAAPARGARRAAMAGFARRFQQFTAPVLAKGVEDTAFYRYHRLVALNEVGNDPGDFGFSLRAFHAASEDRARNWPRTMISTSTHDTKRSEDVRARLGVLSELPSFWRLALSRWSKMNRRHRTALEEGVAPSAGDEYLFYQTLLGIWPYPSRDDAVEEVRPRVGAYMLKAVREAKLRTSWINPDAAYEAALERFVSGVLGSALFVKSLEEAVSRIAPLGMLAGLSQALIKVASPGVPDYYQGTELWEFSLVDPDNRRPVDYALRNRLLEELSGARPGELLRHLADGRAKLHVISRGLALRRRMASLFARPSYVPLHADAGKRENLCAFALRQGTHTVIAVAPRLFAGLLGDEAFPLGERVWGEARIALPDGAREFTNVLTGERVQAENVRLRVADLLAKFPVALLASP